MSELIPQVYRGLSWVFLYLSYLGVCFAVFGLLVGGTAERIRTVIVATVVLYVAALAGRLMAWALEDFVYGSFTDWNNS